MNLNVLSIWEGSRKTNIKKISVHVNAKVSSCTWRVFKYFLKMQCKSKRWSNKILVSNFFLGQTVHIFLFLLRTYLTKWIWTTTTNHMPLTLRITFYLTHYFNDLCFSDVKWSLSNKRPSTTIMQTVPSTQTHLINYICSELENHSPIIFYLIRKIFHCL